MPFDDMDNKQYKEKLFLSHLKYLGRFIVWNKREVLGGFSRVKLIKNMFMVMREVVTKYLKKSYVHLLYQSVVNQHLF